jgi:hypothetical protein
MKIVIGKLLISLCGVAAAAYLLHRKRRVSAVGISLYYAARIAVMVGIGLAFNHYPGDVPWFRDLVNAGRHAGRFHEGYGSLFCLLLGGALSIFDSPVSVLVLFSVCEWIGALLIFRAFTRHAGVERASFALILYLFNPIVLQGVWLGGQDEGLQVLAVGVLLALLGAASRWVRPLAAAVSLHATKPQSLWAVAPFLLAPGLVEWAGFALFAAVFVVAFHVVGFHDYAFLGFQSPIVCSGTVWFVVEKTLGHAPGIPVSLGIVSGLFLLATLWCLGLPDATVQARLTQAGFAVVLYALIFALFGPFVFPQYCTCALPFVGYLYDRQRSPRWLPAVFGFWSFMYAVDATFNYRVFHGFRPGSPLSAAGILWALAIIGLHAVLLGAVLQQLRRSGATLAGGWRSLGGRLRVWGPPGIRPERIP